MTKPTIKPIRVKAEKAGFPGQERWSLRPRTRAAYDAMHAQIVRALERADVEATYDKDARVALRAIGITRPKE